MEVVPSTFFFFFFLHFAPFCFGGTGRGDIRADLLFYGVPPGEGARVLVSAVKENLILLPAYM